jgi:dihydroflavonol-4-reductase
MKLDLSSEKVLVTGGSGFIGLHCILHLLNEGRRVRSTLRDLPRQAKLRQALAEQGQSGDRLEFVEADLLQDEGWEEAAAGCRYVIHIASPFPLFPPRREADVIVPARQGTLRVLRAAARAGAKRVVYLSSVVAMFTGRENEDRLFTETDWPNMDRPVGPYEKSKTLAERAAWDFIKGPENENRLELSVVNPPFVYGPPLDGHYFTSSELLRTLICREMPGVARVKIPIVDVRDLAAALSAAMTVPEAAGERFPCCGGILWMQEIARILREHYGKNGYRPPTWQIPDLAIRLGGLFDRRIRLTVPALGWDFGISSERIQNLLGWQPRPLEETILDMAEGLIEHGFVPRFR